jgi:hypothetical protein
MPGFKWTELFWNQRWYCLNFSYPSTFSDLGIEKPEGYGFYDTLTVHLTSQFNISSTGHFPEVNESANGEIWFVGLTWGGDTNLFPDSYGGTFTLTRIE